jgi:hypothetical protein
MLKKEYSGFKVDTGQEDLPAEMKTQLDVTPEEITHAINAENLTDRIFTRILKQRAKSHETLMQTLILSQ